MEGRYEKYILQLGDGVKLQRVEGENNEVIFYVSAKPNNLLREMENFANPPVPTGYRYVSGEWRSDFVIERLTDGSRFVWVPADGLEPDGTLDGRNFVERFGRRNFRKNVFSKEGFHEDLGGELTEQVRSVRKYGGFYISVFNISKSDKGTPQSVKNAVPWTNVSFKEAKEIASSFEDSELVSSHLPYGAEYDSVFAWLIQTGSKSTAQIKDDSSDWGNHWDSLDTKRSVVKTGSNEKWKANEIYDLAGNVSEWTQEMHGDSSHVSRGSTFKDDGSLYPVAYRYYVGADNNYQNTGFRVVLCIK